LHASRLFSSWLCEPHANTMISRSWISAVSELQERPHTVRSDNRQHSLFSINGWHADQTLASVYDRILLCYTIQYTLSALKNKEDGCWFRLLVWTWSRCGRSFVMMMYVSASLFTWRSTSRRDYATRIRALIVGLLVTERSLLPVRRSGSVCHTTLLTSLCRKLKTFLFFLCHCHDYVFLFSGLVFGVFT